MRVLRFATAVVVLAASAGALAAAAACGQSFTATGGSDASTQPETGTMPDAGDGSADTRDATPTEAASETGPSCPSPDAGGHDFCVYEACKCLHGDGFQEFFDRMWKCQCDNQGMVGTQCIVACNTQCPDPLTDDGGVTCPNCLYGLSQVQGPCSSATVCAEAGAPVKCVDFYDCAKSCPN